LTIDNYFKLSNNDIVNCPLIKWGGILQDIYLNKEKLNEIKETVKELGVSL